MKTLLSQCRKLECYAPPPTSCTARDWVQLDGLHTHEEYGTQYTHTNKHTCAHTRRQTDTHTPLTILALQLLHIVTDSQTDRQTNTRAHTHRETDRHTHLSQSWHCSCSTLSQTDRQTNPRAHTHRQTDTHTSLIPGTVAAPHCQRQTDRQTHTCTHSQTDRQTNTRAHTHRQTDRHTHLSQPWHCSCSTLSLIMSPLSCSLQKMSCAILRGERKVYSNHYTT